MFDWATYESFSDFEDVPLLLSIRSQQMILAVMQRFQFRSQWLEVDDATWDDIEASIDEAYEEIMEQHETIPAMLDALSATWHRNTDQAIAANTETAIIWNSEVTAYGLELHVSGAHKNFIIPTTGAGFYQISGTVYFPGTAATQVKQAFVLVNADKVLTTSITLLTAASVQFSVGIELQDNDQITVTVLCPVAISMQGNDDGLTAISIARGVKLL